MSLEQFNASLNWRIMYESEKQKRIEEEIDKEKNKNRQLQEQKKKYNSTNSYNRRWTTHYPKGIVASEKELSSPDSGRRNPTYDRYVMTPSVDAPDRCSVAYG